MVRLLPFHRTVEPPFTKFVPFTVRVNAVSPAVFVTGLMLLRVGAGLLTTKGMELEVAAGEELYTVICGVPPVAMSAAVIAAVSCVAET